MIAKMDDHLSGKAERRISLRWDKAFSVLVESPLFGYMNCIARNISCGGLFLETRAPLPLGSPLRIYFTLSHEHAGISAQGLVRNHYFLNYNSDRGPSSMTGMGVRFTKFDDDGEQALKQTLKKSQLLH